MLDRRTVKDRAWESGGFCGWMETSALILVFYLSHCWGPNVEMP